MIIIGSAAYKTCLRSSAYGLQLIMVNGNLIDAVFHYLHAYYAVIVYAKYKL